MMMVMVFVSILAVPPSLASIIAMDPMVMIVMTRYPHVEIPAIPIVRAVIVGLVPNGN